MHNVQKILIIRLSSIGDIVLASPLIRVLRENFPRTQLDFVVKSEYAELVKFNHHLSSVIELRTSDFHELRQLRKKIREERYDVIFDIHNSLRSRFLRAFSRGRAVTVVNKRAFERFVLIKFKWNLYKSAVPVAERYLETAHQFGVRNDGKGLEIFVPDGTLSSISSMMGKYRLGQYGAVIGIAPSAKHNTKMWLQERFGEVALEAARTHHAKVFLFGGSEDFIRCEQITRSVNSSLGAEASVNLAGTLSLLETAAALDFCDIVLCNDTGIMHLAAARQRNILAIFGPTVKEFGFFPYGTNATVIEQNNLPCRPCTHIGSSVCPVGHFRCMKDTTVEQVVHALTSLIVRQQKTVL